MPPWAIAALIIQLFATWFIPPVKWGIRSVFFGDLWFFVWVFAGVIYLLRSKATQAKSRMLTQLLMSAALILVIYVHGHFRPTLVPELSQVGFTWLARGDDIFQPFREGVVAARFISWIWGAILVSHWFSISNTSRTSTAMNMRKLQSAAIIALTLASLTLLVAWLSPATLKILGAIYRYDPQGFPWSGRIYGVFRSPLEASLSLGLCILLLRSFSVDIRHRAFRRTSYALGALGIIVSKTLTPVFAWLAAVIIWLGSRKGWRSRIFFLTLILSILATAALLRNSRHDLIVSKSGDFFYRFGPWKVYWEVALSRWDLLLLGFGFTEHHVDNIYVFLFNRGGASLLLTAMTWMGLSIRRRWCNWSWPQRTCVIYLLVTGLVLDAWVLRPVVALWVMLAIPALQNLTAKTPQFLEPPIRSS